MGKGDKRSRKGKIWSSSYGNSRPKLKAYKAGDEKLKAAAAPATPAVESTPPAAE